MIAPMAFPENDRIQGKISGDRASMVKIEHLIEPPCIESLSIKPER
jgi:hypothetical protein